MEKIKAGEGMYLTQKELVNEGARVFAVSLWLADNDSPENWREATQEEYYEWQRRQEELTEAALNGDPETDASAADASTADASTEDASAADASAADASAEDASAADGKEAGA